MRYYYKSASLLLSCSAITFVVFNPFGLSPLAAQTVPTATEEESVAPASPATPDAAAEPAAEESSATVAEYVRQGDRHYAAADYEDAIASYTQSLGLFNRNAYAYYNRGNAYRQLENHEEALADYNRALQLNPEHIFAYLYRGMVLQELGEDQVAVASYTAAIERNGSNPLAYEKRGEAYHAIGEKKAALDDLEKALKLYRKAEKYRQERAVQKQIQKVKSSKGASDSEDASAEASAADTLTP